MNQDDQNDAFEQKFADLGQASRTLSTDVAALNDTLRVVTALQQEQALARARQIKADELILKTAKDAKDRDARTRRALAGLGVVAAIVLGAVAILVYVATLNHVNDLLAQNQANTYASCKLRNQATTANADREFALSEVKDQSAAVRKIHLDSAEILRDSLNNCEKYRAK